MEYGLFIAITGLSTGAMTSFAYAMAALHMAVRPPTAAKMVKTAATVGLGIGTILVVATSKAIMQPETVAYTAGFAAYAGAASAFANVVTQWAFS
jgi:hypothetical protein